MANRLIIDNVVPGDLLSDILQAEQAVLLDRRGALMEQIQLKNISRTDAAKWLVDCALQLDPEVLKIVWNDKSG